MSGVEHLMMSLPGCGPVAVQLNTAAAAANTRLLLERLPLSVTLTHSMLAGEALEGLIPGLEAQPENPRWFGIKPGTLGVEVPVPGQPGGALRLVLVYGSLFQFRTAFAPTGAPLYVIGQAVTGLDGLLAAGRRCHDQGECVLRLMPGGSSHG